ncbi:activator of Hsp90 ATPase 1 family protein [Paenibacillus sp. LMG 31460]|uniref:Activator of Hsp90 ATPase 1 family protein n=1 Tax=Paenibacillus germinis TaxID=2654979 RepID=A0ABX1YW98_9BACL|nr:SRPBCC family protein [Paenibacillus germinis]NOU85222.1 activator of Hsp90 ATPase 1 family protein [Paenibacillus germinis]
MLASIQKVEGGYVARFDRPLKHSVEKVWAALTENVKLARWMSNLQVEDLRIGGNIKFDMKDESGTFIDTKITDFQPYSVLEFEWGNDRVRFELYPKPEGCLLVLNEFISAITDHTPKDLSGWHICLDMMYALLDGHPMDFPKADWEKWYEKYKIAVSSID